MKLEWDKTGERLFETGVDHGVLYKWNSERSAYDAGVVWNGLTSVTERPEGAEETEFWADNMKYAGIRSAETFGATIEAYTYPDEFLECDGTATPTEGVTIGQQNRVPFAFSYRTKVENDTPTEADDWYKINIIYFATASPSEKAYETINDSPDAVQFSWEVTTNPTTLSGYKPTSKVTIDSKKVNPNQLKVIEETLYGTEEEDATLPLPDELIAIIKAAKAAVTIAQKSPEENAGYGSVTIDKIQDVTIGKDGKIAGTLYKLDSWPEVKMSEDIKHYLSLTLTNASAASDAKVYTQVVNGDPGTEVLVDDGFCVYGIRDPKNQQIKVRVESESKKTNDVSIYDISGLTLSDSAKE